MSTKTIEEIDIDVDAATLCEDADHVGGDAEVEWLVRHHDCIMLICQSCYEKDLKVFKFFRHFVCLRCEADFLKISDFHYHKI